MLQEIAVQDLCIGMYVKKVNCPWVNSPFWRNEFLVSSYSELERIQTSSVQSVWIDCDKGKRLEKIANDSVQEDKGIPEVASPPNDRQLECTSLQEEMERAAEIIERANGAVKDMFNDVRMGRAIDVKAIELMAQSISESVARNGYALISLARLKTADQYTYLHSVAVCALMSALARQLQLSEREIRQASLAGLLHDVGKAEIPLEILNKPERLSEDEFNVIKHHPLRGYQLLRKAGISDEAVLDVCLHHHEKLNGCGYPDSKKSQDVSLMARMGAICDIYDAITSTRPYKNGWDPSESIRRMHEWCGSHLDTHVFHAFVRGLGIYPIGSLVRLDNKMLGVVTEQGSGSLLKPIVKIFFCITTMEKCLPIVVDLACPNCECSILQREDPGDWLLGDWNSIWIDQGKTEAAVVCS